MSRLNITFNGVSSDSLGLIVRSTNRQLLPGNRDVYTDIPQLHGSYLFPDKLSDRLIEVEMAFVERTMPDIRLKARQIAAWLRTTGREQLVFNDEPDKWYEAKVANQLDLEPLVRIGRFKVTFRCLPHANAVLEEYDEAYEYDTGLDYDSGIIYPNARSVQDLAFLAPFMIVPVGEPRLWAGFFWSYTQHFSSQYHYGSDDTPLIIRIAGNVINPSITNIATGEVVSFATTLANQTLLIDGKRKIATIDGVNAMLYFSGDFIRMPPGENKFIFSGASPYATVTYLWENRFL